MLSAYIEAAMRHAEYRQGEDGTWFGDIQIPGFEGVWSNEPEREDAERDLRGTVEDWLLLSIRLNHRLPVVANIDLNAPEAA